MRSRPLILGAISLDLFAVLLGGATALLPAIASDVLHVGPAGLGWLRAAPGAGAAICGFALSAMPMTRRVGHWMFGGVIVFGLATVAFFGYLAHAVLPSVSVLYMGYRYGWGPAGVGLMMAGVGLAAMIVQGGLIRPITARIGERRTLLIGLLCGSVGFSVYGLFHVVHNKVGWVYTLL